MRRGPRHCFHCLQGYKKGFVEKNDWNAKSRVSKAREKGHKFLDKGLDPCIVFYYPQSIGMDYRHVHATNTHIIHEYTRTHRRTRLIRHGIHMCRGTIMTRMNRNHPISSSVGPGPTDPGPGSNNVSSRFRFSSRYMLRVDECLIPHRHTLLTTRGYI